MAEIKIVFERLQAHARAQGQRPARVEGSSMWSRTQLEAMHNRARVRMPRAVFPAGTDQLAAARFAERCMDHWKWHPVATEVAPQSATGVTALLTPRRMVARQQAQDCTRANAPLLMG